MLRDTAGSLLRDVDRVLKVRDQECETQLAKAPCFSSRKELPPF